MNKTAGCILAILAALAFVFIIAAGSREAFGQSAVPFVKTQYFGLNGTTPNSLGFLCSYVSGTSTPLATYTSSTLGTANTNPVVLDSTGRADIFLTNGLAYTLQLFTSGPLTGNTCNGTQVGAVVWTENGIIANNGSNNSAPFQLSGNFISPTNSVYSLIFGGATTASPLTTFGPAVIAGTSTRFVASSAAANAVSQSLLVLWNTGGASVIDSDAVGGASIVPIALQFAGLTKFTFQPSGDLSINTTVDNGFKLDVQGNAQITGNLTWGGFNYTPPPAYPSSNGYILASTTAGITSWVSAATGFTTGWSYSSPIISETTITDHVLLGATTTDMAGSSYLYAINPGYLGVGSATSSASYIIMAVPGGGGVVSLSSGHTGSGTTLPVRINFAGGAESTRFQTSGNVNIGSTVDSGYKLDVNGGGRFLSTLIAQSSAPISPLYGNIYITAPSAYAGNPTMNVFFKPDGIDFLGNCNINLYPCGAAMAIGNSVGTVYGNEFDFFTDHGLIGSPNRLEDMALIQGNVYLYYLQSATPGAYVCYNTSTGLLSYNASACVSMDQETNAELKQQIHDLESRVQQLETQRN